MARQRNRICVSEGKPGTKFCPNCEKWLPATEEYFYSRKTGQKGLAPYCKGCTKLRLQKWDQEHAEEQRLRNSEYSKRAYAKNPEKFKERNRQQRKNNPEIARKAKEKYDEGMRQKRITAGLEPDERKTKIPRSLIPLIRQWRFEQNWPYDRMIEELRSQHNIIVDKATLSRRLGKRLNEKPGVVYVVRADNGLVKVGETRNLPERLKSYNTHLPYDLEILYTFHYQESTKLEAFLHGMFANKRVRFEWFRLDADDLKELERLAREYIQKAETQS